MRPGALAAVGEGVKETTGHPRTSSLLAHPVHAIPEQDEQSLVHRSLARHFLQRHYVRRRGSVLALRGAGQLRGNSAKTSAICYKTVDRGTPGSARPAPRRPPRPCRRWIG